MSSDSHAPAISVPSVLSPETSGVATTVGVISDASSLLTPAETKKGSDVRGGGMAGSA
jgi:hypothetical protein